MIEPRLHIESTDAVEIKCDADLKEAWEYCDRNSKNIEIIYEDDDHQKTLAKVHFRFNPKVSSIVNYAMIWLFIPGWITRRNNWKSKISG